MKIAGHTDADGDENTSVSLFQKRAELLMNALFSIYNTSLERLPAEGMGESQPVGDSGIVDGKARNRRVEFMKQ